MRCALPFLLAGILIASPAFAFSDLETQVRSAAGGAVATMIFGTQGRGARGVRSRARAAPRPRRRDSRSRLHIEACVALTVSPFGPGKKPELPLLSARSRHLARQPAAEVQRRRSPSVALASSNKWEGCNRRELPDCGRGGGKATTNPDSCARGRHRRNARRHLLRHAGPAGRSRSSTKPAVTLISRTTR